MSILQYLKIKIILKDHPGGRVEVGASSQDYKGHKNLDVPIVAGTVCPA